MKTVKEYLSELNTTRLVDTLFEEFGDKLFDLYYFNTPTDYHDEHIEYDETVRELTVMEYAQARRKELYDYIRYLKDLEIKEIPGGKTGVIYAFKKFEDDYFARWQIRLLFLEDLLDDPETCKNHDFEALLHTRGSGRNTGRLVWKRLKRAEATMSRICPLMNGRGSLFALTVSTCTLVTARLWRTVKN